MKTIDELKEVGLTCHNLIQVKHPKFWFNEETGDINYNITNDGVSKLFILQTVKIGSLWPPDVKYYNDQKLIAWIPTNDLTNQDGNKPSSFRFAILK